MSDLGAVDGGSILIENGLITEITNAQPDCEQIDAGGRTVTPGLIDSHTHAVFAGSRANEYEMRARGDSYQDIAAAGGGILSTVKSVREADEDGLWKQSLKHAQWMLDTGTTTAEIKSGYGLTLEDELKMLRVIRDLGSETPLDTHATLLAAHAVPPEFKRDKDGWMQTICEEIIPAARELIEAVDIFIEQGYFDANDARQLAEAAKKHGLALRMHVDQLTNSGGAKLAAELRAVSADHLEQTTGDGVRELRRYGVFPVLLPGSVYALGLSRYPNARLMIDEGLPVVLATDFNPGSSPTPSLQMVMSFACTHMAMTPAEALTACTANPAALLGIADHAGRIEPGMQADLVIWDTDDYRDIPYYFGVNHAHTVIKKGRVL
jgi:imidazolonepropionase